MTRQSLISRRRVLGVFGAGTTVGIAGCSGDGQEGSGNGDSGSGGDGTDSPSGSGGTSGGNGSDADGSGDGSTGSSGNEPGEYPDPETSGVEAEMDRKVDKVDGLYSFVIDDYDFLKIDEFEDPNRGKSESFAEALYLATFFPDGTPTDEIYFIAESKDESLGMKMKEEDGVFEEAGPYYEGDDSDTLEDFYREHVDPDGIVNATDLEKHDDAVEALHSGFGSE